MVNLTNLTNIELQKIVQVSKTKFNRFIIYFSVENSFENKKQADKKPKGNKTKKTPNTLKDFKTSSTVKTIKDTQGSQRPEASKHSKDPKKGMKKPYNTDPKKGVKHPYKKHVILDPFNNRKKIAEVIKGAKGVYIFEIMGKQLIYVGSSINLYNRVCSYFMPSILAQSNRRVLRYFSKYLRRGLVMLN